MQADRNFDTIEYLNNGNERQLNVYDMLTRHLILERLVQFDPIVVGTIPIEVDIENSDIDILCYCTDKEKFADKLKALFQHEDGFAIWDYDKADSTATVARFKIEDLEVEIFGQGIPTRDQIAYRHMVIEYKILLEKGEDFRRQVIELKRQGIKTEPAFALLLGLKGDPYAELLKLFP